MMRIGKMSGRKSMMRRGRRTTVMKWTLGTALLDEEKDEEADEENT